MPPAGGRNGMLGLLRALATEPAEEGGGITSPARALAHVARHRGRPPGSSSIVSDFRGPRDWRAALTEVAGRHAVIAIEIADPREDALVDVGELTLVDPETGRTLRVDTGDRRLRHRVRRGRRRRPRRPLAARVRPARRPPSPTLHRGPVAARARARLPRNPDRTGRPA